MKFDYARFPNHISLPAIRIRVRRSRDGRSLDIYAVVDSGADHCIFPRTIALDLGIADITSGIYTRSTGIGGAQLDCYFHPLEIRVGGWWLLLDVAFSHQHDGWPLLGRRGFFDNFVVVIDHPRERLELKQVKKKK